jgi:hypothetical protein
VHLRDDQDVVAAVLQSLERGGAATGVPGAIWSQAGTLRVRRETPRPSARGKHRLLEVRRRSELREDPVAAASVEVRE